MTRMTQWFTIECKNDDQRAVIFIFDEIGLFGVSANDFAKQLKDLGELREIELHINSPGGSVFDGLAIYNLLNRHPATITVFVDGLAASIASVIVMSGDTVIMPENALLMLHRPSGLVVGSADDMRRMAELLEKTEPGLISAYRSKSGLSDEKIAELMDAETWLTAAEAVELGFADRIEEAVKIAAHFDLSTFNRAPANWPQNNEETLPGLSDEKIAELAQRFGLSQFTSGPENFPTLKEKKMSEDNKKTGGSATPQPVDIDTLQDALPDTPPEFQILCLKQGFTLPQAKDAWMEEMGNERTAADEALKAKDSETAKILKAKDTEIEKLKAAAGKPGLEAVSDRTSGGGDGEGGSAAERVEALVAAKIKLGKPAHEAYAMVMEANPDLRDEFVAEHNELHRPQRRGRRVT